MPTPSAVRKLPASLIRIKKARPRMAMKTVTNTAPALCGLAANAWRAHCRGETGRVAWSRYGEPSLCVLSGHGVRFDQAVEIPRARAVDLRQRLLDGRSDSEEGELPVQEGRHGHFVGGVEHARVGTASLAGLSRQREQRERLEIRGLELQHQPLREIERRDGRCGPLRVREREGDRDAHVGVTEMRERGAVAKT